MFYIILNCLIYAGAFGALFFVLGRKHLVVERQLKGNLEIAMAEFKARKGVLAELAGLSLGLVKQEDYDSLSQKANDIEESIRAEKGRLTITEAELEAIDIRLRELEELKRELEVSNMDAVKELEMLRSQERDTRAKNDALRNQLESSLEQLDLLLDMLASSAQVVARLTQAKNELIETEKKCSFYEEQIANINQKYMVLKRAYDALDIEYAQLYEKHQSSEANN